MRILVVGSFAPSLLVFRGPLLRSLKENGHTVLACAPKASPEIVTRLEELGIEYVDLPLSRAGLNPLRDAATIRALGRIMHRFQPERVLAYTAKPVIYSAFAARLGGRPQVYGMITGLGYAFGQESGRQRLVGRLVRRMYRVALQNCAGIFFQNPDDRELFSQAGLLPEDTPVTLINGSGVDLDYYAPVPLPDAPVFLLIARLLADKGIREYVAAARAVKAKFPEARFQLAGWIDPNPMSIRREELAAWQEEGVIEYLGALDDVRPALAGARFYVLPSYREGTPRTVLEAMAMGRPVITTDAPGCRETVVDGDNGFLVPVKNIKALQAAMEKVLVDPDLAERMGNAGLQRARDKYDVHKVNAVIMEAMGL
jgi:glycosyltransferase involved in cell wall biosynthesis